ncbi:uncharacterized protein [Ambystoma mexicanum]
MLWCNNCLAKNQETCNNPFAVPCSNSTCATISELFYLEGEQIPTYEQSCLNLPPAACEALMRLSVEEHLKIRVTFDCCNNTNNCNTGEYKRQREDAPPNGLKCPVCFKTNFTEPCDPFTNTMDCTLNEEECVTFIGKLRLADASEHLLSFRGCTIQDGCTSGFSGLYGTSAVGNYTLDCKAAMGVKTS